MGITLVTGVKLVILAGSAIALGVQRRMRANRHQHESTLALVSSPELRNVGCQRLCVPTDASAAIPAPFTFFVARPDASQVSSIRPMKMVGEFRPAGTKARRSPTVQNRSRAFDGGVVLVMSDRTLRVTTKMPLRKM